MKYLFLFHYVPETDVQKRVLLHCLRPQEGKEIPGKGNEKGELRKRKRMLELWNVNKIEMKRHQWTWNIQFSPIFVTDRVLHGQNLGRGLVQAAVAVADAGKKRHE